MTIDDLLRALRRQRFRLGTEAIFQEDAERFFRDRGIQFKREHVLGPGERVDFLLFGKIAVELKVRCSPRIIMRQLQRYAAHDTVKSIILISASAVSMPDSMNGKPVYVVNLGAGYL